MLALLASWARSGLARLDNCSCSTVQLSFRPAVERPFALLGLQDLVEESENALDGKLNKLKFNWLHKTGNFHQAPMAGNTR